ncbi:hypothetical protein [Flavobacterium sp. ov086]|uniref:hypothetical protein n=1 Tax=Flavobacterium sp. ov086 TaxID=1761785 RepID=UPI001595E901|nr:hypothetical protein [Flavobacterium sp. ov086]
MIYNTAAINDVVPGFYYRNSAKLAKTSTESDSAAGKYWGTRQLNKYCQMTALL